MTDIPGDVLWSNLKPRLVFGAYFTRVCRKTRSRIVLGGTRFARIFETFPPVVDMYSPGFSVRNAKRTRRGENRLTRVRRRLEETVRRWWRTRRVSDRWDKLTSSVARSCGPPSRRPRYASRTQPCAYYFRRRRPAVVCVQQPRFERMPSASSRPVTLRDVCARTTVFMYVCISSLFIGSSPSVRSTVGALNGRLPLRETRGEPGVRRTVRSRKTKNERRYTMVATLFSHTSLGGSAFFHFTGFFFFFGSLRYRKWPFSSYGNCATRFRRWTALNWLPVTIHFMYKGHLAYVVYVTVANSGA